MFSLKTKVENIELKIEEIVIKGVITVVKKTLNPMGTSTKGRI